MHPTTLLEWQSYVQSLSIGDLYTQGYQTNQMAFYQTLQQEGWSASERKQIVRYFALRFQKEGLDYPAEGVYSFASLVLGK